MDDLNTESLSGVCKAPSVEQNVPKMKAIWSGTAIINLPDNGNDFMSALIRRASQLHITVDIKLTEHTGSLFWKKVKHTVLFSGEESVVKQFMDECKTNMDRFNNKI